jgi:Biotin-lipoyl like
MSFVCSLPLIANLFTSCAPVPPLAVGYVEGEHVLLAPVDIAAVKSLAVKRGDKAGSGDILAVLEDSDARNSVAEAEAALSQAQDQLANLKEGKRPEEIGFLQAALNSALAETSENERVALRLAGLAKQPMLIKPIRGLTFHRPRWRRRRLIWRLPSFRRGKMKFVLPSSRCCAPVHRVPKRHGDYQKELSLHPQTAKLAILSAIPAIQPDLLHQY